MNEQIIGIAVAVLAASAPVVRAWVKTKFTSQRLAHVASYAHIAVNAAEELGKLVPAEIANRAEVVANAKLNSASEVVASGAKKLGLKLTQDEVLAFVHSALSDINKYAGQF